MSIGTSLKVARNAVTSKAGRTLLVTQKHSPAILFGAGVIGVVATAVLASKATLQLTDILDEKERTEGIAHDELELGKLDKSKYTQDAYDKDMLKLKVGFVKDVAKLYAPAAAVGVLSIGALTGSHVILTRRNAALAAAYATVNQALTDYRKRVVERFDEQTDRELMFGVVEEQDAIDTENGTEIINVRRAGGESMYARKFDRRSPSWEPVHNHNVVFLKANRQYANDMLHARGHIFLNEVYDMLGIERTAEGQIVGWVKGNADDFVSFGPFDSSDAKARDFVRDREGGLLLDFNVDGNVLDLIGRRK